MRFAAALLFVCATRAAAAESCAACHPAIARSYVLTGMGRSFALPHPANAPVGDYYHAASDQHFTMRWRGGHYYQRRHLLDPGGRQVNIVEREIHFVLGSGNHSRAYLHQRSDGQLEQAPVGWYAEGGGSWAMNPGYDRPDHMNFHRKIDRECFFCHNSYPEVRPSSGTDLFLRDSVPLGIGCFRCHGPADAHIRRARSGATPDSIRGSIVNPARLDRERQLEVCLQCHLESSSRRLPYALRRAGRGIFSYVPGEPLSDYILHFDHAPGAGYDDKFEINGSAYRFLKSRCYLGGNGSFTCTTCHDPHQPAAGPAARDRYLRTCAGCHRGAHRAAEDCVSCHMPRRRTDDVVHVSMTDHWIRKPVPSRDLLAPKAESHHDIRPYRGEVVVLYPRPIPADAQIYLAAAQVVEESNLEAGIPRLRAAIDSGRPAEPRFYLDLAEACASTGRCREAVPLFQEAIRRGADSAEARRKYAAALSASGKPDDAVAALGGAHDAATLNALGAALLSSGRPAQAVDALRRALRLEAHVPEIYVNLGGALSRNRDPAGAVESLRAAIRLDPACFAAHVNLGELLHSRGDFAAAQPHFQKATLLQPGSAIARYDYGRALAANKLHAEARRQLSAAVALAPDFAEAHVAFGLVLAQAGEIERSAESYRAALRIQPRLMSAHFNLALALLGVGDTSGAKTHFQIVADADPGDRQARLYLDRIRAAEKEPSNPLLRRAKP